MKKGSFSFFYQGIMLTAFFVLFYIFSANLYYYAVSTAHYEFGDLMMIQNNVFIPEYWAHLTPRYILPVSLITVFGASFCGLFWSRSYFSLGYLIHFFCWPKSEMSSVELTFTIAMSFGLIMLSSITPAFCARFIKGIREKRNEQDKEYISTSKNEILHT